MTEQEHPLALLLLLRPQPSAATPLMPLLCCLRICSCTWIRNSQGLRAALGQAGQRRCRDRLLRPRPRTPEGILSGIHPWLPPGFHIVLLMLHASVLMVWILRLSPGELMPTGTLCMPLLLHGRLRMHGMMILLMTHAPGRGRQHGGGALACRSQPLLLPSALHPTAALRHLLPLLLPPLLGQRLLLVLVVLLLPWLLVLGMCRLCCKALCGQTLPETMRPACACMQTSRPAGHGPRPCLRTHEARAGQGVWRRESRQRGC